MAIEVAGREYRTLSDDIFVNDKKVYIAKANDQIVYPDDNAASYVLAFGKMSRTYMIDWLLWDLDNDEQPVPRESDIVQSYDMSFAFAISIYGNRLDDAGLNVRYCTGANSLVGRARNPYDSIIFGGNEEEVLKYQHYDPAVGVPNDIYDGYFPGGYLIYHTVGLNGNGGYDNDGANYLFFQGEKHLVRHDEPVVVHPDAYKLDPEFTSIINEPDGWSLKGGMWLLGWNPSCTAFRTSGFQHQAHDPNPYLDHDSAFYVDDNACCIGVLLMDIGYFGGLKRVTQGYNYLWYYCAAYAPITEILYLGDDPEMASIDRVELYVDEFNDYSYRLLY